MAQFYASIQGNRGEATRMGGRASGIQGHIRGWDVGVSVSGHDGRDGDYFNIYVTGGSGGGNTPRRIGTVKLVDGVPTFVPRDDDEYSAQRQAGLTEGMAS